MLEILLLGQFAVRRAGEPLAIGSRPAETLLSYLLLNVGSRHRREKLTALLWPDVDEANARQGLRNALWKLNKVLGEGYLLADKISVGFDPAARFTLDVALLEATEHDSIDAQITSVSAYKGELLAGFYDEWILFERERFQAVFERKVKSLLERLAEEERWHDVLHWAERWISLGQAPEPAYRALMQAHSSLGDMSGMASAYRRCVQILQEDLGLEPSAETQELYQSLLKGEAQTRRSQPKHPPREPVDVRRPPEFLVGATEEPTDALAIVGRDDELASLEGFLSEALNSQGRVVFVTGEAGQGKTSLLSAFSRRAQERRPDLIVALGNCTAYTGVGDQLLPFRDVLDLLSGDVEARWLAGSISRDHALRLWRLLPATMRILVEQAPELLGRVVSLGALVKRAEAYGDGAADQVRAFATAVRDAAATPAQSQSQLFEAYGRLLHELSQAQPLVLLIDDLHWVDDSSAGLLFHLGRRLQGSRILLVGAYRPEDILQDRAGQPHPLRRVVSEFERAFGATRVDLDGRTGVRAFIDKLLDSEDNRLGDTFRERLGQLTEGNPLFAVELLQEMKDQGSLRRDDEGHWVEGTELTWAALPARIEGVIRIRLERVETSLREALTVGSIEGSTFTAEVVAAVLDTDARSLTARLSGEAERRHHLIEGVELRRVAGQRLLRYRFRHSLFQQYLYNDLSPMDRAYLHEQVGTALEALHGNRAGELAVELARHFREAGLLEKAVHYLTRAGEHAIRLSAHEEALAHLQLGLELLESLAPTQEGTRQELELLLLLGSSLQALRGYAAEEVGDVFDRARKLSMTIGDPRRAFSAMWSLALYHTQHAEYTKASNLGSALLSLAEQEDDDGLRLQAHHTFWFAELCTGEFAACREHTKQGIGLYDPFEHHDHALVYGGHDPGVCARLFGAKALWHLGYPDQALAQSVDALVMAERLTHPNSLAHALAHAAEVRLLRRDGSAAQELAERTIGLAEAQGFSHWRAWGALVRGAARAQQGQLEAGIAEIRAVLATFGPIGAAERLATLVRLAEAHLWAGQPAEALSVLADALAATEQGGTDAWTAEIYRLQGELLRTQGDTGAGPTQWFERAIDLAHRQGSKALELRATLGLLRHGRGRRYGDAAAVALAGIVEWFTEGADTPDLIEARQALGAS